MSSTHHTHFYLFLLLIGCWGSTLSAQLTQRFQHLNRTHLQYLLDKQAAFARTAGGDKDQLLLIRDTTLSLENQLDLIRQELVNLPAFTRADWRITEQGEETLIHWEMEESRTVFPLVNFGGIRNNSFYQIGINDIHFRGRGQQLTTFYQNNDGEHNYYLSLRNDAYRGSRWGYRLETRRYAAIEPVFFPEQSVNYRYANLSFGLGLSYAPSARTHYAFGWSTFRERYIKLDDGGPNSPGPDDITLPKWLLKFERSDDQLDRLQERVSGNHHQTILQAVRNPDEGSYFLIGWHDFRWYRLTGKRGNLAARLRTGLASNNDTPFAPFVLDSQVNIRGSGNRIDRGTAQLILNLEYRHTVWRDRKQRFAAQLVGFSDFGTWRKPGGRLAELVESGSMRHFVGAGIRLISLKAHDAVLRLDYGVDAHNTRERGFVAGFGQYF